MFNRGLRRVALLLFLLPFAHATPLAELMQRAEQYNSDFRVQQAVYEAAREKGTAARAALLPQLSASMNGTHDGQNEQGWSAGLSLAQPLYNQPSYYLWQVGEEQVTLASIQLAEAREVLRRDVILAWLDVQLAVDTLRLVQKRYETLKAQLERTQVFADAGRVIEADVLSARAGLASAEAQWTQATHDLATAHDVVIHFSAAAAAERQLVLTPPPSLPPLARWMQRLEEQNLSLQAARQQAKIVRRQLQAAEGAILPQLSLSGNISMRDSAGNIENSWQLSLRQPLFTGGSFRSEQRRLIAESEIAHGRVAALLAQLTQTVRRLHGQMQADIARREALAKAAASAEALLRAVTVGYENGVNIIAEVLDAEADVFDALLSQRKAAYSYLQNLVRVQALFAAGDMAFAAQIEQLFIPPERK